MTRFAARRHTAAQTVPPSRHIVPILCALAALHQGTAFRRIHRAMWWIAPGARVRYACMRNENTTRAESRYGQGKW